MVRLCIQVGSDPPSTGQTAKPNPQDKGSALEQEKELLAYQFYLEQYGAVSQSFRQAADDLAKSYIERAKIIQNGAVIIAGIYSGILGFGFVTGKDIANNPNQTMPWEGLLPTVFFGISIFFTMIFVAPSSPPDSGSGSERGMDPVALAAQMTVTYTNDRKYLNWWSLASIRIAILSLGLGVATLPVAFIQVQGWIAATVSIAVFVVSVVAICIVSRGWTESRSWLSALRWWKRQCVEENHS